MHALSRCDACILSRCLTPNIASLPLLALLTICLENTGQRIWRPTLLLDLPRCKAEDDRASGIGNGQLCPIGMPGNVGIPLVG